MRSVSGRAQQLLVQASWGAAAWAFGYGLYRAYYAAGGTIGMLGTPVSLQQWRLINAIAAGLLLGAAVLPIAVLNTWQYRRARPILLAVSWVIAVSGVTHGLIGIIQRVFSLAGELTISYPFWVTIDRRRADLQAIFFNEPWFLIEGLLWVAIAWGGALHEAPGRRWWLISALAATIVATGIGLLSAFGVIEKVIVG